MRKLWWIIIVLVVPGGLLLGVTVLSKRWWARRIERRWPEAKGMSTNKILLRNTSFARLIEIYRNGGGILFTSTDGTKPQEPIT